jgi:hypothetical protein
VDPQHSPQLPDQVSKARPKKNRKRKSDTGCRTSTADDSGADLRFWRDGGWKVDAAVALRESKRAPSPAWHLYRHECTGHCAVTSAGVVHTDYAGEICLLCKVPMRALLAVPARHASVSWKIALMEISTKQRLRCYRANLGELGQEYPFVSEQSLDQVGDDAAHQHCHVVGSRYRSQNLDIRRKCAMPWPGSC